MVNRIDTILALIDEVLDEEVPACIHGCPDECEDPTAGFLYPQDR